MTGNMMRQLATVFVVVMLMMVGTARGHGMMLDPPQRSSVWRFSEFSGTTKNYNDNQLFCGGFSVQYDVNGGKCGICGDDFRHQHPRPNEAGGMYGKGIIVKTYQHGQIIDVKVKITANHMGYFIFKLCPNNDVTREVTQECLDSHVLRVGENYTSARAENYTYMYDGTVQAFVNVIRNGQDDGERFYINSQTGDKMVRLQLPSDITCSQCVLQWKYNTGNSWGCDNMDGCCVGCGKQENFVNCADVAITSSGQTSSTEKPKKFSTTYSETQPTTRNPDPTTTQRQTTTTQMSSEDQRGDGCRAFGVWVTVPGMHDWCRMNCAMNHCPESHCICS